MWYSLTMQEKNECFPNEIQFQFFSSHSEYNNKKNEYDMVSKAKAARFFSLIKSIYGKG